METRWSEQGQPRLTVRRSPDLDRYELLRDDELVGVADYRIDGDRVVMPHTTIRPEHRGQGLGEHLVREALVDIRRSGRSVVPHCWFVAEFVELNPEFGDLVTN